MTIQPFKNDQAVAPMVSNVKTFAPISEVVLNLNSSSVQNSTITNSKTVVSDLKSVVLSGATRSPGKETASNLAFIRNDMQLRTEKATAASAATTVEKHLSDMQQVIHFTKNYPSFGSDDAKRQAFLMTISGIREQIQKMTLPPPPPAIPPSGMWKDLFHGIDVPSLPATGPYAVGDTQLQAAHSEVVASAQISLAERRTILVQQALPTTSLTPSVAVLSSMQIGQQLATSGLNMSANLVGELYNL